MPKRESFPYPVCGEEVPANAKACPACGSDEKTGWSDDTVYDATEIPDDKEFDYREFLEKEGLAKSKWTPRNVFLIVVTIIVIAVIAIVFVLDR